MMKIAWEKFGTIQVPCRDGRLLCSPRNPELEARNWLDQSGLRPSDQRIAVVGLGGGAHLLEILRQYPKVQIFAVELEEELCASFAANPKIQICHPDDFVKDLDVVLAFRPAWQGRESEYLRIYVDWAQLSIQGAKQAAEANGLTLTAAKIDALPRQIHFSLKALDFQEEDGSAEEIKMWRCLRELVR